MSKFYFNLVLILLLVNIHNLQASVTSFTDMDCLNANFTSSVAHKGEPFGLTDTILKVEKKNCVLNISHEKLKWISSKWIVDVCRGPVHIKRGTGAIDVLKKKVSCKKKDVSDDFCNDYQELSQIIQDDGLIFANGEKENIGSDHGKIYCTFLLIKSYLGEGVIFSRYNNYENVLMRDGNSSWNSANAVTVNQKEMVQQPEEKKSEETTEKTAETAETSK